MSIPEDRHFQSLYAGSQQSLSDLAHKHASALRRVGSLREDIVKLMKRTWPAQFSRTERDVPGRISDVDDAVLLAYLEGFISAGPDGLTELRDALTLHGITLPAVDDLHLWARHLKATSPDDRSQDIVSPGDLSELFGAQQPAEDVNPDPQPEKSGLDGLFGDGVPLPEEPGDEEPFDELEPVTGRAAGQVVRPQAAPAPQNRSGRRNAKTKATPPEMFDVPPTSNEEPADGPLIHSFMETLTAPRPVFHRDLAQVPGSSYSKVQDWQNYEVTRDPCRAVFIGGKDHHGNRGPLVVPNQDTKPGWWSQCVDRYRGADLYELAVVLHRHAAEVHDVACGDHVVLVRARQARGLMAIVVVLTDASHAEARKELSDALGVLSAEQLQALAVLTPDPRSLDVAEHVTSEVAAGLPVSFPVVSATTWAWADSSGASAKLLIQP